MVYELKELLLYIEKNTTYIEFRNIAFNLIDWFIIKNLIKIFEIFVKPLVKLQGQIYITLLIALIYIYKIFSELFERQSNQNTPWVSNTDLHLLIFITKY